MNTDNGASNWDTLPDVDFGQDQAPMELMGDPATETIEESLTNPPQVDEPAPTEENQSVETFNLDGEEIPIELARELISKGKDYTKKTQEVAELRKQADERLQRASYIEELESFWASGPQGQAAVIQALSQMAGINPEPFSPQPNSPSMSLDEMSDEGRMLYQEKTRLERELAQVKQQNQATLQALQKFESYIQSQNQVSEAHKIAAQIKQDFGAEVNAEDLYRAAQTSGIQDLYAAWLKENRANIAKGSFKAGYEKAKVEKPLSPTGGQTRTFDPNDPKYTADDIFRLMRKGYVPKD